jgi:two-component system phosphate regulon sensor histidine kinase PhoR
MVKRLLQRFYPNIGTRITAPFLLATVIIAGIGVFIVTRLVAGSIEERINNQLVDSARAAKSAITTIERDQLADLRSIVFTTGLGQAISEGDIETIETLMLPILVNEEIDYAAVFTDDGEVMLQFIPSSGGYAAVPPTDTIAWPGIERVLQGETDVMGDKFVDIFGIDEQRTVFLLSAPVINAEEEVVGGVSIGIDVSDFVAEVGQQSLSNIILYLPDGSVLSSTYRTIPEEELTIANSTQLLQTIEDGSPVESQIYGGITYQVLYTDFNLRSEQVGILATALPRDFITDQVGSSRNIFAGVFTGLFFFVALMGILVTSSINRPIQQMVETTTAIRQGDLSRRVGLRTPDELGNLSTSFDIMTEQLIARNEEVEKLYREQLIRTAERDAIITSISDAVVVVDARGTFILSNAAAQDLIERSKVDPYARDVLKNIWQNPTDYYHSYTLDLMQQVFSVLAMPVLMEDDSLLGYVVIFRDITAIIQAERLKDKIILQLSHELRTPLASALGFNDLLLMLKAEQLDADGEKFARDVNFHLRTLNDMVNQVIQVSQLIAGQFELDISTVNLNEVVQRAIDSKDDLRQRRQHQIQVFPPAAPIEMAADEERLRLAIAHIIDNAYNYMKPGGTVEVTIRMLEGVAYIYILDYGVGISDKEILQVFDVMYRAESADAGETDTRGLGLGLYIVRQIVEAHQGSISLKSELNVGTTVTLQFPMIRSS